MSRAVIIAGALIAAAILMRAGWTQTGTTPFMTGIVVTACGTAPVGTRWTYAAGSQAPFTLDVTGKICNNI
jgi:hypothetical protein